ncbi:NAD regulator [Agaricicola taiwanensis]|uniref:NAD regulator n=1 Tax=Agaricicola taiwanensis TaxID=591372 RepID=A0A8J2YC47_9RHOB|nr:NAD regulator [Agaricicola taiwanensis]GGE35654.1 NAD regulator [Agaricicola taiwanensis]
MTTTNIEINLTAAIVAPEAVSPTCLVVREGSDKALTMLPSGPFDPVAHRTFEAGLRTWVAEQAGLQLGYAEQLYTFGDRGRHARASDTAPHVVSVGYLALTQRPDQNPSGSSFRNWYGFFPWEDWRQGRPEMLDDVILPALTNWAEDAPEAATGRGLSRMARFKLAFGLDGFPWDEEKVLDRYELLYSAGLLNEARRDGREEALRRAVLPVLGASMQFDHRRILATAMGRLRSKLKYRPVIFELMSEAFTLTDLQRMVEGIAGRHLHKQNFRRLVEATQLVEPTGERAAATGGRPAQLYRFRRAVLAERPAPGLRFGA